ncbi:ROK family protein [Corynebacterium liangguodongii]|nr:ROK family protein [Corynebacterium liangguodongii]
MDTVQVGKGLPALAVDVGGTNIKAGFVHENGEIEKVVILPTPPGKNKAPGVIDTIVELSDNLAESGRSARVGSVLIPGVVNDRKGIGVHSENLGWDNVPFADILTERLGYPVSVTHDVRGSGIAEYQLGYAHRFDNVVVLTIGTGIAGAIFINRQLIDGDGFAGEIGHIPVFGSNGPLCVCGQAGCLETVASAAAVAREYQRLSGIKVMGGKEVIDLALSGDTLAARIWDRATLGLAKCISQLCSIIAPEAILFAGGFSGAGDTLLNPVSEKLDSILTFQRRPEIGCSKLGAKAGLVGAALQTRTLAERLGL